MEGRRRSSSSHDMSEVIPTKRGRRSSAAVDGTLLSRTQIQDAQKSQTSTRKKVRYSSEGARQMGPSETTRKVNNNEKDHSKGVSPRKRPHFDFKPPPEAPVFHPTEEEFENPLHYINSIRPIAQKSGICKIVPPSGWKPPFALDENKLTFTPRIQKINELEAGTRIKLNFFDKLSKFWALRGSTFRVPLVERRVLDLYSLHTIVEKEGGLEEVTKGKKWCYIARQMGYVGKTVGLTLRMHYDQLILPYFMDLRSKAREKTHGSPCERHKGELDPKANCESCQCIPMKATPNFRELKGLAFLGPGPKMAVCDMNYHKSTPKTRTRGKKILYEFDPLAKFLCKSCSSEDVDEALISCEKCEDKYHPSCINPNTPENSQPKVCLKCITVESGNPFEEFGFAQAEREYTLKQFGDMANEFKSNYFKENPGNVPPADVEQEFWRIVSSIDETVTVEYGADLHVIDHGSGFPMKNSKPRNGYSQDEWSKYIESPWNLNNLPVLKESVLRHIKADISGMKIPWMYVGMCFSTFCWHNEDHWSYSINYLHWGEPKTWYGVPGSSATHFENTMKSVVPELFKGQPDLLHQLVTIMNPNELMAAGVPMCRTDQYAGEFVITFPRAYHAGFNQGLNFAEACNFAPYDWLKMGRECISHYSSVNRFCVFSHDELICNMAEIYEELDKKTSIATYQDLKVMLSDETHKRCELKSSNETNAIIKIEQQRFDLIPDDERQCCVCKTTCFLSAAYCTCDPERLTCLDHIAKLCRCDVKKLVFKYQFKLNELLIMYKKVKDKHELFNGWVSRASKIISRSQRLNRNYRVSLEYLREFLQEAAIKKFPKHALISYMEDHLRQALEYSSVAKAIIRNKVSKKDNKKILYEEFVPFYRGLRNLICIIPERNDMKDIYLRGAQFINMSEKILMKDKVAVKRVMKCMELGDSLNVGFPQLLGKLKVKLLQSRWLLQSKIYAHSRHKYNINYVRSLVNSAVWHKKNQLIQNTSHELSEHIDLVDMWLEHLEILMDSEPPKKFGAFVNLLEDAQNMIPKVPAVTRVHLIAEQYVKWNNLVQEALSGEVELYIDQLSHMLAIGKKFPIHLEMLSELEKHLVDTKMWMETACREYLKKDSPLSLIQVLWPRKFVSREKQINNQLTKTEIRLNHHELAPEGQNVTYKSFKKAVHAEVKSLMKLRMDNCKSRAATKPSNFICACGFLVVDSFVECDLCRTLFHKGCLKSGKVHSNSTKTLCTFCVLSKRPSFDTIVELVTSSEKLALKTPECIALQFQYERILKWQAQIDPLLYKTSVPDSSASSETEMIEKPIVNKVAVTRNQLKSCDRVALKQLLVLGEIMEVTTKEVMDVRECLRDKDLEFHWEPPKIKEIEEFPEKEFCGPSDLFKVPPVPKRRKRSSLPHPCPTQFPILPELTPPQPPAKRPRKPKASVPKSPPVFKPLPAENLSPQKPKRKYKRRFTKKPRSVDIVSSPQLLLIEEHVENEECASDKCVKPSDEEVDWVQCDGECGLWFHMKCANVTKQDLTEEDEFVCEKCDKKTREEPEIMLDCQFISVKNETDPLL